MRDLTRAMPTLEDTSSSELNTPDTLSSTSPICNPALAALLSLVMREMNTALSSSGARDSSIVQPSGLCCFNSTSIAVVSSEMSLFSSSLFVLCRIDFAIGKNDCVVQTRDGIVNDETEKHVHKKENENRIRMFIVGNYLINT